MEPRKDILDLRPDQLVSALKEIGQKPYRARQLQSWIYARRVLSFAGMSDLSAGLREELESRFVIGGGVVEEIARSGDGAAAKFLLKLRDGALVEAVSLRDENGRHTICLSSQVGCAMGCAFCATAGLGFKRNLSAGEILLQPLLVAAGEAPMKNIVFMGMGEPLLNLPQVLPAIEALTDPHRGNLGARHITVSTCGILPGIEELARCPIPVRLALSLNSPFQSRREELMPIAKIHRLPDVLDACERYWRVARRRVSLEYVLMRGVNTNRASATELGRIARRMESRVNLIEYNPVAGSPFASPQSRETLQFRDWLMKEGLVVTIRFRRGREIAAGCGQLAGRKTARAEGG